MSRPSRTARRPLAPDGTPSLCRDGCGARVMWFTSSPYGKRVMLDVDPVDDDDDNARWWINWDAAPATAVSWRKRTFLPTAVGQPKYSSHGDTCAAKTHPAATS